MKVLTNTQEMLILDHKPWLLSLGLIAGLLTFLAIGGSALLNGEVLFGMMFAGVGIAVWGICFMAFAKRVQVILDMQAGQIVKRKRSVLGYAQDVYPLQALRGAELEETRSDGSTLYRPVLVMDGQPNLPVVSFYTNGFGPHRTADAINAWVEAHLTPMQLDSAPRNP